MKKIVMGADSIGVQLKDAVKEYLEQQGYEVKDFGVGTYYKVAADVAAEISEGRYERGILVCGSGMGMAITANKFKGVYAAVCESVYSARYSRIINNSNVLALGRRILGDHMALEMVDAWLTTEFVSNYAPERQNILRDLLAGLQGLEEKQFG